MQMSMSMPMMVFTTATNTPLYATSWTPSSTAGYAGTCIFLIAVASIYRGLFAFRTWLERRWVDQTLKRRYVVVAGKTPEAEKVENDEDAKMATLVTAQGVDEKVRVVRREYRDPMPWRIRTDMWRAALVMVTVGVGYLLMLAVMTMNVGYFISVLVGTFLGECGVGRFSQNGEH